jgi:hypothetical protein
MSTKRLKRLQRMATARGCDLVELYDCDAVASWDEDRLWYELDVGYPEPVRFDDMDEVEADLNSRKVMS